jgi:hypothetical protein
MSTAMQLKNPSQYLIAAHHGSSVAQPKHDYQLQAGLRLEWGWVALLVMLSGTSGPTWTQSSHGDSRGPKRESGISIL